MACGFRRPCAGHFLKYRPFREWYAGEEHTKHCWVCMGQGAVPSASRCNHTSDHSSLHRHTCSAPAWTSTPPEWQPEITQVVPTKLWLTSLEHDKALRHGV